MHNQTELSPVATIELQKYNLSFRNYLADSSIPATSLVERTDVAYHSGYAFKAWSAFSGSPNLTVLKWTLPYPAGDIATEATAQGWTDVTPSGISSTTDSNPRLCQIEGYLYLMFIRSGNYYYTYSQDDGLSWEAITNFGASVSAEGEYDFLVDTLADGHNILVYKRDPTYKYILKYRNGTYSSTISIYPDANVIWGIDVAWSSELSKVLLTYGCRTLSDPTDHGAESGHIFLIHDHEQDFYGLSKTSYYKSYELVDIFKFYNDSSYKSLPSIQKVNDRYCLVFNSRLQNSYSVTTDDYDDQWICYSTDGGLNWTEPVPLGLPSYNASLTSFRDTHHVILAQRGQDDDTLFIIGPAHVYWSPATPIIGINSQKYWTEDVTSYVSSLTINESETKGIDTSSLVLHNYDGHFDNHDFIATEHRLLTRYNLGYYEPTGTHNALQTVVAEHLEDQTIITNDVPQKTVEISSRSLNSVAKDNGSLLARDISVNSRVSSDFLSTITDGGLGKLVTERGTWTTVKNVAEVNAKRGRPVAVVEESSAWQKFGFSYTGTNISFISTSKKIQDYTNTPFGNFVVGERISVLGSTSNDGKYTINTVAGDGSYLLVDEAITYEIAGSSITVGLEGLQLEQPITFSSVYEINKFIIRFQSFGSPSDLIYLQVYDDSSGYPGTLLSTGSATMALADGWATFTMDNIITTSSDQILHLKLSKQTPSNTAYHQVYLSNSTSAVNGAIRLFNDYDDSWNDRSPFGTLAYYAYTSVEASENAAFALIGQIRNGWVSAQISQNGNNLDEQGGLIFRANMSDPKSTKVPYDNALRLYCDAHLTTIYMDKMVNGRWDTASKVTIDSGSQYDPYTNSYYLGVHMNNNYFTFFYRTSASQWQSIGSATVNDANVAKGYCGLYANCTTQYDSQRNGTVDGWAFSDMLALDNNWDMSLSDSIKAILSYGHVPGIVISDEDTETITDYYQTVNTYLDFVCDVDLGIGANISYGYLVFKKDSSGNYFYFQFDSTLQRVHLYYYSVSAGYAEEVGEAIGTISSWVTTDERHYQCHLSFIDNWVTLSIGDDVIYSGDVTPPTLSYTASTPGHIAIKATTPIGSISIPEFYAPVRYTTISPNTPAWQSFDRALQGRRLNIYSRYNGDVVIYKADRTATDWHVSTGLMKDVYTIQKRSIISAAYSIGTEEAIYIDRSRIKNPGYSTVITNTPYTNTIAEAYGDAQDISDMSWSRGHVKVISNMPLQPLMERGDVVDIGDGNTWIVASRSIAYSNVVLRSDVKLRRAL